MTPGAQPDQVAADAQMTPVVGEEAGGRNGEDSDGRNLGSRELRFVMLGRLFRADRHRTDG